MATPVSELIASVLESRLNLLTVDGDYETTVCEVVRPTRLGTWTPQDLQIVLTQDSPQINEELSYPGNPPAVAYEMQFNVRCHVMTDERDETAVDTTCNRFAADVVKAVCSTGTDWYTMGGYAINAQWQAYENIDGSGSLDGVNVPLLVTFRTDEGNPYTVRS
jgi:hypothetical protein